MAYSQILYLAVIFSQLILLYCYGQTYTCPVDTVIDLPVAGKSGVEAVMTEEAWQLFFKGSSAPIPEADPCTGTTDFFTFSSLVQASKSFPMFCNSGNFDTDRREIATFLAHMAHETSGGWSTAPCGHFSWGLCYKEEVGCESGGCTQYCSGDTCSTDSNIGFPCPCTSGKTYHGRGPIQLSYNYNYALFSKEVLGDETILLNNPERVAAEADLAWKSALWFWHKPQGSKPSSHDVVIGKFQPTEEEMKNGGYKPGFGMITNIINGGVECGCINNSEKPAVRVGYYDRFSSILESPLCAAEFHSLWCSGMQTMNQYPLSCPPGTTPPSSAECEGSTGGDGGSGTPTTPNGSTHSRSFAIRLVAQLLFVVVVLLLH